MRTDVEPLPADGKRSKSEVLSAAGVSTSAANRAALARSPAVPHRRGGLGPRVACGFLLRQAT